MGESKASSQIIGEMQAHIEANGAEFSQWYVGVTDAPKKTLFSVHKLKDTGDAFITRRARDDLQALSVVEYFQTVMKTRGSRAKTSLDHVVVYAYKIKPHTRQ